MKQCEFFEMCKFNDKKWCLDQDILEKDVAVCTVREMILNKACVINLEDCLE